MKKIVATLVGGAALVALTGLTAPTASATETVPVTCTLKRWVAQDAEGGWLLDRSVPPPGVKVSASRILVRGVYECPAPWKPKPNSTYQFEDQYYGLSASPEADYNFVFSNPWFKHKPYIFTPTEVLNEIKQETWWNSAWVFTPCENTVNSGFPYYTSTCGDPYPLGELARKTASVPTQRTGLIPATIVVQVAAPAPAPTPTPQPTLPAPPPVVTAPVAPLAPEVAPAPRNTVRAWTYSKARKFEIDTDPNGVGERMVQLQRLKGGKWKNVGKPVWTKKTHRKFNPTKGTYRVKVLGWSIHDTYSNTVYIRS